MMSLREPGPSGQNYLTKGRTKCSFILQKSLAIQLQKNSLFENKIKNEHNVELTKLDLQKATQTMWMYDSGYLIFQGFLDANMKCFWNQSLLEAIKLLEFYGYVSPGILLVSGEPRVLEVVRVAWSRNVLKPPVNYTIVNLGDIEDCLIEIIPQGQFTPLPEALCWVIFNLTSVGQPAVIEGIMDALKVAFPDIHKPSRHVIYDSLAELMGENKIYQTSQGYFVVTPESRRFTGHTPMSSPARTNRRNILMSADEVATFMHGEMETRRDGRVTHQNIQTNLADIIMGGNASDKILIPKVVIRSKKDSSQSVNNFERRHSMRVSCKSNKSKRFSNLQRSASLRHLNDNVISEDLQSTAVDATASEPDTSRKSFHRRSLSLFSRLFRRSTRSKQRSDSPSAGKKFGTFSEQFPPKEWFNQSVKHLHSVGTQTMDPCLLPDEPRRTLTKDVVYCWEPKEIAPSPNRRSRSQSASSSSRSRSTPRASRHISTRDVPTPELPPLPKTDVECPSPMSQYSGARLSTGGKSLLPNSSPSIPTTPKLSTRISSPTSKSFSSSSSGYNSLPRSSNKSQSSKLKNGYSCHNKTNLLNSSNCIKEDTKGSPQSPPSPATTSSVIFQVSTSQTPTTESSSGQPNIVTSSSVTSVPPSSDASLTSTINGNNITKIFLQQNHHPNQSVRSLFTLENASSNVSYTNKPDLIILNMSNDENKPPSKEESKPPEPEVTSKPPRPNKDTDKNTKESIHYQTNETLQKEDISNSDSKNIKNKLREVNVPRNNLDNNITKNEQEKIVNSKLNSLFDNEVEYNNTRKSYPLQESTKKELKSPSKVGAANYAFEEVGKTEFINKIRKGASMSSSFHEVGKNSIHHISYKNMFKDNSVDSINDNSLPLEKCDTSEDDASLVLDSEASYPEVKDFPYEFSSIAAQKILKGISLNSIDTLVECNMAADKKMNQGVTTRKDFGLV